MSVSDYVDFLLSLVASDFGTPLYIASHSFMSKHMFCVCRLSTAGSAPGSEFRGRAGLPTGVSREQHVHGHQ